ncbi:hypothetical protein GPX89_00435 [Nocardia sp. ET3-3]|uniref:Uncharacterized protein n=1 Tax=Nocardia terrae TaxID=2675851 RepID=A0A7K1UNG5_9NOCA|nr:hypothetical protein [Nocardia terrae]
MSENLRWSHSAPAVLRFYLEALVTSPIPAPEKSAARPSWPDALGRLGADWWSVIVSGVVVALAVFDALPKIPW